MGEKKKIAVLGAGMGSLSAVYWLTSLPEVRERYEITVYQQGWRLGGKGANGRNAAEFERNQEHGFHILFGFYENVFRTMVDCYRELGREKSMPLSEFMAPTAAEELAYPDRYAMKRSDSFYLAQEFQGDFKIMPFDFPRNDQLPGDGERIELWNIVKTGLALLWQYLTEVNVEPDDFGSAGPLSSHEQWWIELKAEFIRFFDTFAGRLPEVGMFRGLEAHGAPGAPLALARHVAEVLPADLGSHLERDPRAGYDLIARCLELYLKHLWTWVEPRIETDWRSYRAWILQDFVATNLIGLLRDRILLRGFDSINHINFFEWFLKHGPVPTGDQITLRSVMGQFGYDNCFAYEGGDSTAPRTDEKPLMGHPDLEAGTMLRGGIRMFLGYKGSLNWEFQAGCGDVLATPMYHVLKRRGVCFRFFHRVKALKQADGLVTSVLLDRQVTLKGEDYDPLILVKGIESWPSEPLYDQIIDADAADLKARGVDLESFWTDWQGTEVELRHGTDFDQVLLGISIGALPYLCQELIEANDDWKAMVSRVKTTRTLAFQTWLTANLKQLGWEVSDRIVGDCHVEPCSVIATGNQLLERECWPETATPRTLAFFAGVLKDDPGQPRHPDPAYPATQLRIVRRLAIQFLSRYAGIYWPDAMKDGKFDWDLLIDPHHPGTEGEARIGSQYLRANIDPTERYVLSVVDSSRFRLDPGRSGFANLFLAGDWTRNGLNAGCMEATFMSGMQASRAICGYPEKIEGELDPVLELGPLSFDPNHEEPSRPCSAFEAALLVTERILERSSS